MSTAVWRSPRHLAVLLSIAAACTATAEPRTGPAAEETSAGASPPPLGDRQASSPDPGTALAILDKLAVQGRAPKTGYSRDAFGSAWIDVDDNGCDTRNDILARDLSGTDGDGCTILAGRLDDPYTGGTIPYERGASQVDIDHVVALSNAWVTGAAYWTDLERREIANDPLNLLAVSAAANRGKRDGDAATWLPSNKRYRCRYIARQIAVKAKYGLWVTAPEKAAFQRVLAGCPDEPAPEADPVPKRDVGERKAASVRSKRRPEKAKRSNEAAKRYRTCKEVKAAGLGPFVRGRDPEYEHFRDADHDGQVCE